MTNQSRKFAGSISKSLTAVLAFVAALQTSHADIHTWTGTGANKLWSNPTNWQAPAGAPTVGESSPVFLSFPSGVAAAALRSTNDIANLRVDTIALNGDNYHLAGTGAGTSLNIGIGFLGSGNSNQIESSLALVVSNTVTFNLSVGAELSIQSVISGPGGLWQTGEGSTITLSGLSANIYSGLTRVDGGTLQLQNGFLFGTVAVPGQLIIGSTNGNVGTVRYLADDQIADSSAVSIYGDSYLYLEGHNDTIGSLDMIGATIYTDGGLLTLNGNVTYRDWPAFDGAITGRLGLGSASRTFDIVSGVLNITANIESTGTVGIIKEGTNGVLGLWGTNTYTGHTTINAGQLNVRHNSALGAPGSGAQGTTVNPGGELLLFNGFTITGELLQLNSSGVLGTTGGLRGSGTCSWNGNVTLLGNSSVSADMGAFLTINGVVSGSYSLTKTGPGIVRFSGSSDNTYTGGTFVNQGVLQLSKSAGSALAGPLTIGNDNGGVDADVVRLLLDSQIPDNALITINSSGLLDLNAHVDVVGSITFNGGHLDSGNPTTSVWLGGDITVNANTNAAATIDGGIFFYGNTNRTFNTVGHYYSPDLRVRAFVSGQATAALVKTGIGEMGLYHTNNTYSGATIVQKGSLQLHSGCEPGSTAGGTVVSNGAQIALLSGAHVGNESLTLYGNATNTSAYTMFSGFGSNSWDGPVILSDDTAITVVQTNDVLNLGGLISGPGGLSKIGAGMLRFSGGASNSFAGGMFVNAGVLILAHTNETIAVPGPLTIGDGIGGANADEVRYVEDYKQIRREAHVHINSSGWLNFAGFSDSVGQLTGSGSVNLGPGGGVLAFGFDNSDFAYNGQISGSGAVNKYGTGTATLAGNSPFTGFLIPQFGTLLVNGSLVNADASLFNASSLGGTGQVRSIIARTNTTVSPGASPGQLSVSQGVTCMPGSIYKVEVNGLGAGTTYDQIAMNGVLNLTNAVLQLSLGFNSAPGDSFLIINNYGAGAVNGTFAGLPQSGIVTVNGAKYRISYTAGSGNDVSLTHINTGPILTNLNANATGIEGSPISLSGFINDPDAGAVRLIVNWGDGTAPQTNSYPGGSNTFTIPHTYADDNPTTTPQDTYTIVAFLQDAAGAISPSLNDIVTISNVAPVVNAGGNVGLRSGQSFTNSGSFTDPGADAWTATVDYGDGGGAQALSLSPNKTFTFNHTFPSNGVYNVRTIVRDDDQGSGTNLVKVVVGLRLNAAAGTTNQIILTWPTVFSGFTLQSSSNLTTTNWTTVTNAPGISGENWIVPLPATNTLKHFRLVTP